KTAKVIECFPIMSYLFMESNKNSHSSLKRIIIAFDFPKIPCRIFLPNERLRECQRRTEGKGITGVSVGTGGEIWLGTNGGGSGGDSRERVGTANLQAGPSNASILSEVHDLENAIDPSDNHQVEHEIHDKLQQKNVIESTSANMGNSNVIPYEQYLTVNNISVVPSNASSILNDAYVFQDNHAYVPPDPLATELNIYKEQVAIYEQRTKFELTLHEQKMDEQMSVQNPFYPKKAKKAQPELSDGDELLKMHHVPVIVTSFEEDLELAETTRIKMNEKMNDSVCVEKRVESIPPKYSKENFMATFTPQTQLTPEQVFWSTYLLKQRAEDLKANAPPLLILPPVTVYPPNTPVHLVPRTLPTTSQVNIEVIPFFNLLKEHFDGVKKSLVTEVRAMKAAFENMEAEVDQNAIDKKCGEIERKNFLITNEHLIANCIAQDVFYTVTDSALTASRFHDLFTAYNVAMKRIAELESEKKDSKTLWKQKPVTSSDAPTFDSVFVIGQLKEQVQSQGNTIRELKEKISRLTKKHSDADPILDLKALAQIKENSKCVTIPDGKPKVLTPGRYAIDVEPIPSRNKNNREVHLDYIKHLKEIVETLREIIEEAKVDRPLDSSLASAFLYTKHYQELLEYVIGTCPKEFIPRDKQHASTPLIRKKQVTIADLLENSGTNRPKHVKQQTIQKTNVPIIHSTEVSNATKARRSQPKAQRTRAVKRVTVVN
ncbi:hypothetical protein Tco_0370764, partial [Tanacetum coccineum]